MIITENIGCPMRFSDKFPANMFMSMNTYVDAEAGKRALELVLAIYQSSATGEIIKFPMKQCATIDFKGRFS